MQNSHKWLFYLHYSCSIQNNSLPLRSKLVPKVLGRVKKYKTAFIDALFLAIQNLVNSQL